LQIDIQIRIQDAILHKNQCKIITTFKGNRDMRYKKIVLKFYTDEIIEQVKFVYFWECFEV